MVTFRSRHAAELTAAEFNAETNGPVISLFGSALAEPALPLFGVIGGKDRQKSGDITDKANSDINSFTYRVPEIIIPQTKLEVDFSSDLTWIGKTRRPLTNELIVWICGMLYLGGLHWSEGAKRVGMSPSAFRTFKTRAAVPVDPYRKKFSRIFDERTARATLAVSGHTVRQCISAVDGTGNWFWVKANDFGTRLSPQKRKRDHEIEGRFNRIEILKPLDFPETATNTTPFARDGDTKSRINLVRSGAYA